MDIGDYIKFTSPEEARKRPPKVKVASLYNRPIRVTRWEIRSSRFADGAGEFAEVDCEISGTGEAVRFNTGSRVVISQLLEVAKAMDEAGADDRTFSCVIRAMGSFIKLFPALQEAAP